MNDRALHGEIQRRPGCVRIHKHVLASRDCTLPLAGSARILHAAWQDHVGKAVLWVEEDVTHAAAGGRRFVTLPTGGDVPEGGAFVGTFLVGGGALVWHVYEVPR